MKPFFSAVLCASLSCAAFVALAQAPLPPAPPAPPVLKPTVPCLFLPADLTPILNRTPGPGVASSDARGSLCTYTMSTKDVRRLIVEVDARYTAERFQQRLKLASRVAAAKPVIFENLGDGAFYVAGVAGVRRGLKYVEISGLRQAAARPIKPEDAFTLLQVALERLPQY